jgi:Xaa-Pro dipeptidase
VALHFTKDEFAARREAAIKRMAEKGLHGLLMFRQESMYYLTGYDTFGYVFFQCLYLGRDGRMTLLTRAPDLRQAKHTSVIEDIRIWVDAPDAKPAVELRGILEAHGAKGKTLGVEWEAYGLTARNGRRLAEALEGFCSLADASELVSELRAVKSPAEIGYVREAARLADMALYEANRLTWPDADEGDILAQMQGAVFRGGGDFPANEFVLGSGKDALLCRYFTGRRKLSAQDQVTVEFAGTYRHYHACLMRTILVGKVPDAQKRMHDAALEAMKATEAALRPGRPVGEAFDAHAKSLDAAGYRAHRLNACGYSLGAVFAPNWMDWPMLYHGNPTVVRPGMVFFLHMIVVDSDAGLAMCPGHSVLVTEDGVEPLSRASLELVCNA